ncbi:redox-active protein, C_GCAxxG_C_C family, putative [Syntrophotalea carbinolica DSM 2380]|uniref:Redox-active protein, C_GCAxxG_C_C family, putative n=1 Tax=Syntrophotalea carbinolica (strain DSM 2380 / NBRC 103641 / GraBd1) TaxID=338963 RepID=Q3A807_SYNC1|nr:DV_1555 family C-GCAxxG-C-C protein [Syntrophotalea carbinolica]ABA87485.1 redox-active protein, C_GCAxxG_C_C family, putative [Syntrophotalea carbinolica DSM 2380]
MSNEMFRMLELVTNGYYCSQILLTLGLDNRGQHNPDLIRTMAGLAHGAGFGQGTCGALTGGACLLAYYAGKGADEEEENESFMIMRNRLAEWFIDSVGEQYGGIDCETIVGDGEDKQLRCGQIVGNVYACVMALLEEYGIDPKGGAGE